MEEFKHLLASIDNRLARLCELQEQTLIALEEVLSPENDEEEEDERSITNPTQEYPEPKRFKIDALKI